MAYDPYDSYRTGGNFGLVALVAVVVACGVALFFIAKYFTTEESADEPLAEKPVAPFEENEAAEVMPRGRTEPPTAEEDSVPETSADILESLGIGVTATDPELLVHRIGRKLEAGEVHAAAKLIGRKALNKDQLERLRTLAGEAQLRLNMERPLTEIGELEINKRVRWALNLDDDFGSRIYFDLLRSQGKWGVQKVVLPPRVADGETPRAVLVDALGITDAFLQAALRQSFETAKSFVKNSDDPTEGKTVSDAKIAGLCILFEEGEYRLRARKPLRAVFNRENTAAFIANVETLDGSQAAQFGVNVQRNNENSPWRVTEINLDELLIDYADRVAGGDVYYTPLVRNPKGGDTLILYFGFDEDGLSPRTERQLEIVSLLLQTDPNKELTLSGHTDAIGSKTYNQSLSARRAEAVREFLIDSGVNPQQIKTVAFGQSEPRRPNTTATGEDNPEGRRANRRTEIYLDF